ncbi:GtrA family protein [Kitasatospora sp. NPDC002040]|uniref:GtrA family protein n=1 Tax=Kitasatospora sp. NPDC002040 TaxID=3154661 RepID=UPI003325E6E3
MSDTSLKGRIRALFGHSAVRFLIAGAVSASVDMGMLYLLHGVLGLALAPSTFAGVLTSFTVNFLLNRIWSFGSQAPVAGQGVRYLIMAGCNWVGTVLLVSLLVKLGLYFLLARALTLGVLSVVNYIGYQRWVFKK